MSIGLFDYLIWRRQLKNPERLIDAVILNIKHQLTEARLQLLAADLAAKDTDLDAVTFSERAASLQSLEKLESTFSDLKTKRNLLISRARDADARLAIERALLAADREPALVAMDMISEQAINSESQAAAASEVRRMTNGGTNSG